MIKPKVLIALSGGVDSSVSAILLKQQGYDLIGVTLNIYSPADYRNFPLQQGINDAMLLSEKLNIPHFVIDVQQDFSDLVISDFIENYKNGLTPNPCALCNFEIKWSKMIEIANEFACDYIATGHYAKVNQQDGRYFISVPSDSVKDQSYFLWRLSQSQLSRTLFPLGNFSKPQIKEMAARFGFNRIAGKRESYNICFIPDGDYRKYIQSKLNPVDQSTFGGDFINEKDDFLGTYNGIWNYTIGQKEGNLSTLGIENYVIEIDALNSKIKLGPREALNTNSVVLKPYNLMKYEKLSSEIKITAKINHTKQFEVCHILEDQNGLHLTFSNPVLALSPGQSIALYHESDMLGGGVIKKPTTS